jgi:hypothetical protein
LSGFNHPGPTKNLKPTNTTTTTELTPFAVPTCRIRVNLSAMILLLLVFVVKNGGQCSVIAALKWQKRQ